MFTNLGPWGKLVVYPLDLKKVREIFWIKIILTEAFDKRKQIRSLPNVL